MTATREFAEYLYDTWSLAPGKLEEKLEQVYAGTELEAYIHISFNSSPEEIREASVDKAVQILENIKLAVTMEKEVNARIDQVDQQNDACLSFAKREKLREPVYAIRKKNNEFVLADVLNVEYDQYLGPPVNFTDEVFEWAGLFETW